MIRKKKKIRWESERPSLSIIRKKDVSSKMIRKKSNSKIIHVNFGGHVAHVGNECIKSSFRFKHMNTIWIDAGICNNCSKKPCEYFKAWKEDLK